jgi:acid stress chaperone HdeA
MDGEEIMRRIVIGALILGFGLMQSGWAQTAAPMRPSKMTCEQFVAVDDVYKPTLVYWVAGVDKQGVHETDTMVVDTATPIAAIVEECKKTPKALFQSKVRAMYKSGQVTLFEHH